MIYRDDIWIEDGWISVNGVGRIGRYLKDLKEIHFDWSMLLIIGTNKSIPCQEYEIKDKILELFN